MEIKRHIKKEIKIGNKIIGGNNPILVQTMANIKTSKVDEVLSLIDDCHNLGCDLIRLSVLDIQDANAFKELTSRSKMPIIADIHFSPILAIKAIEAGASAIRLNPGNIANPNDLLKIIEVLKYHNIPIRIGVNSGSLPKKYKQSTPTNMVKAMQEYLKIFEEKGSTEVSITKYEKNFSYEKIIEETLKHLFDENTDYLDDLEPQAIELDTDFIKEVNNNTNLNWYFTYFSLNLQSSFFS